MVNFSREFAEQHQRKHAPQRVVEVNPNGEAKESDLHDKIIQHCNSQWPRWKYIRARMDQRSTIQAGCQDFTIFMPCGGLLLVECKRKGGKLSEAQLSWCKELEMLSHTVHVIQSMEEFNALLK